MLTEFRSVYLCALLTACALTNIGCMAMLRRPQDTNWKTFERISATKLQVSDRAVRVLEKRVRVSGRVQSAAYEVYKGETRRVHFWSFTKGQYRYRQKYRNDFRGWTPYKPSEVVIRVGWPHSRGDERVSIGRVLHPTEALPTGLAAPPRRFVFHPVALDGCLAEDDDEPRLWAREGYNRVPSTSTSGVIAGSPAKGFRDEKPLQRHLPSGQRDRQRGASGSAVCDTQAAGF